MKRNIIITIILISLSIGTEAKTVRRQLSTVENSVPEKQKLSDGKYEFTYNYSYSVDTVNNIVDNEMMLLQVNGTLSKFSSYKNLRIDSLISVSSADDIMANPNRYVSGTHNTVFVNFPQGKLTVTDRICNDWFKYEEDMPSFQWSMIDSTKVIAGYECQGAHCTFRGREYIAFFTEEIPIVAGPWKFTGLPGLILSVVDTSGNYSFECVGINSNASMPIEMYDVAYNKTSRKKYYDTLHRYETNPFSYAKTVAGMNVTVLDEAGNPDPSAFDPMELSYDFIELDWRDK